MRRSLVAYLQLYANYLQSTSDQADDDSDDDSYDSESEQEMSTEVPEKPDLMEHDIGAQIASQTGRQSASEPYGNTYKILRDREVRHSRGNSYGNSARIMSRYVPNTNNGPADQYDHQIFCGQFSTDGSIYMSACQDQVIRLYTTDQIEYACEQKQLAKPFKHLHARDVGWSIVDCHYSPDQEWLIYSSWSNYIHLCKVYGERDEQIALDMRPENRHYCAFSIRFSPDNKEVLAGCSDYHIYLYDIEAQQRTLKVHAHNDDVNSVSFADDNPHIFFSGGDDGLVKVWDRRSFGGGTRAAGILTGHTDGITCVNSKGDGRYLVSNGKDQAMKLWDVRRMRDASAPIRRVQRRWDYRWEMVPSSYRVRSHPDDVSLATFTGHRVLQTLIRCYFSPLATTGQRYLYTGSHDGSVYVFDILTGQLIEKLCFHTAVVRDVSWNPHRPLILSASWDCTIASIGYKSKDGESGAQRERE